VSTVDEHDSVLPPDDPTRQLTLAEPDDPRLTHVAVVGDTYTYLLTGKDTAGRYALIDMLIPTGSGPPPHRHDFEEMFHVLDGEIELTLRGDTITATAGQTVNIPANAPHRFHNASGHPVRLLCMVAPAGLEDFFLHFGDPVASRTSPPPELTQEERKARMRIAFEHAPRYGIENL
jgi:quercetin dioxygenase-like cupin family protein